MTDSDIMRPVQVRDYTAELFEEARHMKLLPLGAQIETVTKIGDKKLVVTFKDGTRAVLSVAVYRAQDSSEEESDEEVPE